MKRNTRLKWDKQLNTFHVTDFFLASNFPTFSRGKQQTKWHEMGLECADIVY